jgi:hypothetical protein
VAEGEVVDPLRVDAIRKLASREEVDEIIVSTLPRRLSRWMAVDLPHRVRRATKLPVPTSADRRPLALRARGLLAGIGPAALTGDRGDADDRPVSGCPHVRQHRLGEPERCARIHRLHPVPVLHGQLGHRARQSVPAALTSTSTRPNASTNRAIAPVNSSERARSAPAPAHGPRPRPGLVRWLGRSADTVRRSSPAKHTLVGNCSLGRAAASMSSGVAVPIASLSTKAAKVAGCSRVCRGRRQQRQTYWVLPPRPIVFAVRACARAHPACPMSYRLVSDNGSGERSPRSGARRSPAAACWPASRRRPGPARSPRCNRQTRGDAAERPPLARRGSDGRTRS